MAEVSGFYRVFTSDVSPQELTYGEGARSVFALTIGVYYNMTGEQMQELEQAARVEYLNAQRAAQATTD